MIQNNTGVIKEVYDKVSRGKRNPHDMNKGWLENRNDGFGNSIHRAFSRTESKKKALS